MTLSIPALAGDTGSQRATDRYQPPGPVMSARERRTITLFDVMMVVAATAIGLSLVQFGWQRTVAGNWISTWPVSAKYSDGGYPSTRWVVPIAGRVGPFLPCLVAWTGAFLVIRLRGPRPRRRRLLRQPGLVAAVETYQLNAQGPTHANASHAVYGAAVDGRCGGRGRMGLPLGRSGWLTTQTYLNSLARSWDV
jgi:hypothetical protein